MEVFRTTENFALKTIVDSTVLIPVGEQVLTNNILISLNETAEFMYSQLQTERSADELAAAVMDRYEVEKERVENDVKLFLEKMLSINAVSARTI